MLNLKRLAFLSIFLVFCSISLAQVQPQESEDLFLAKKAFQDGFYEIALKHFQKCLKERPEADTDEIQIFIGRCYLNLERQALGLHTLQKVLDKTPKSLELYDKAIYWTAQTYFAAGDYESAHNFFEKIIENPDSKFLAQSYYYRASCYYKRKQFNQALKFYRDFNKRFTRHQLKEESSFRIAQCLYNVKDYSGAHKKFKLFIKSFPKSDQMNAALYYLGEIEYILGNFKKAVRYYTKAAKVSPEVKIAAFAKYARGWASLKLKNYKEALDEFNNLEDTPDFAKSLVDSIIFAKGRCLACLQNYPRAIQIYERIINDFPHSSWFDDAYYWKGQALYELAKYHQACRIYEQAIEKFSRQTPIRAGVEAQALYEREDLSVNLLDKLRYNLGWTYARMKRYEQAIEQFKKVFSDSGERFLKSGALARIGDIYLEQGNIDEAIENYDSVLKDFPDSYYADYAQYQLGIALSGDKRFDSAVLAFNALVANFPKSIYLDRAHYQIGAIYFRQGKFCRAQEKLEDLIKEFPQSRLLPEAGNLLACAYYNNKDYACALDGFRNVWRESSRTNLKMKAQYQIGLCLYQMGREEAAIKEFKRFLSQYPTEDLAADVMFWLGQYYFGQKRFTVAQKYFASFQQEFPYNELADDAAFWQAKTLFNQRESELALDKLQSLLKFYPNSDLRADALLLQGDIFKERGEIDQAKVLYKKISVEFKESSFAKLAHKKSAELFHEQRNFPEAIQEFSSALGTESDNLNAQIQFTIAQCWEEQRDYTQALDEYLKVCYLYPEAHTWSRKAQLKCAQIFERKNLWHEARAIYEKMAGEDSPEAEFARKRLQQLGTVPPD